MICVTIICETPTLLLCMSKITCSVCSSQFHVLHFCNSYWNNIKQTSLKVNIVAAGEYPNVQSDLVIPSVLSLMKRTSLWNEIEIIFETCAKYLLKRAGRIGTTITMNFLYN